MKEVRSTDSFSAKNTLYMTIASTNQWYWCVMRQVPDTLPPPPGPFLYDCHKQHDPKTPVEYQYKTSVDIRTKPQCMMPGTPLHILDSTQYKVNSS